MKKRPVFFRSVKYPGVSMNKYGVVMAERSHELADNDLWRGVDWERVPLKSGNLNIESDVRGEAYDSGCRYRFLKDGNNLWSKWSNAKLALEAEERAALRESVEA